MYAQECPYWCSTRRYRYPRQYHLRLRIARVRGDPRNKLLRQRKEGVRQQKKEKERHRRRLKQEKEERRRQLVRQRKEKIRKAKKFRLLKTMIQSGCSKDLDEFERELKELEVEETWAEYGVEVPDHWKRLSEAEMLEDFARNEHLYLHQTYVQFKLKYGVALEDLLDEINPLSQHQAMKDVSDMTFLQSVSSMPQVQRALIAANDLVTEVLANPGTGRLQSVYISVENKHLPIVFDTGASYSLSPNLDDFVERPVPCDTTSLSGISDVRIRLFSPQTYFKQHDGQGKAVIDANRIEFVLPDGDSLFFPWQESSNLPLMLTADSMMDQAAHVLTERELNSFENEQCVFLNVAAEQNKNLTRAEKKLLLWHAKIGHANMPWILKLAKWNNKEGSPAPGPLPAKKDEFKRCDCPKCTICQLAKQHRRSPRSDAANEGGSNKNGRRKKEKKLMEENLKPGDKVSMDQYISAVPGRLAHTFGKEKSNKQYAGGTLFVDHATGYVFVNHQTSTC
mmetsp:Transcript_15062/g.36800  ORF Transcript_15062/g.36800 Transcript_15062/m.36800 type:complete len:509 (-) Transcript_15062:4073-5599(-)